MSDLTKQTPPEALELKVRATETPHYFYVENDFMRLENYDAEYVSFSGFFGVHSPHVFAAAPELLEASETLLRMLEAAYRQLGMWSDDNKRVAAAKAAIAKAKGEA